MNTKHYLIISGIVGGVIGSLLTALLVPPVTAQRDKFGEIECTSLRIVDGAGAPMAMIGRDEHGGVVLALGKDGKGAVALTLDEDGGGHVGLLDKDGKPSVSLSSRESGGMVSVVGKNSKANAVIAIFQDGGRIGVCNKDGNRVSMLGVDSGVVAQKVMVVDEAGVARVIIDATQSALGSFALARTYLKGVRVQIYGDEDGGYIRVSDKDDQELRLECDNAGEFVIAGGNDLKPRAIFGSNTFGDGQVYTWNRKGESTFSASMQMIKKRKE